MNGGTEANWVLPPSDVRLAGRDVHVWLTTVPDDASLLAPHASLLAPHEVVRAGRYLRPLDQTRFIAARIFVRVLLGRYLGRSPQTLAFASGRYGKPHLAAVDGPGFNVAHSGRLILCAIADTPHVGVDVERLRDDVDIDLLASGQFAASEQAALARLAPEVRRAAFFQIWTRKEAYVKAIGTGFSTEPSSFAVASHEPAVLAPAPGHPPAWSITDCAWGARYAAAAAVPQPGWRFTCFDARAASPWAVAPAGPEVARPAFA